MTNTEQLAPVRVLTNPAQCRPLRCAWNGILQRQSAGITQLDITCSFEWNMALWCSHLNLQDQRVLVLGDGEEASAILPTYRFPKQVHGVPCRAVAPFAELYSGRAGFLVPADRPELFPELMKLLVETEESWDVFQFTLVDASGQHDRFFAWQRDSGLACEEVSRQASPYIEMLENWEQHFASLPKKFRSTIRNGEKRLRERGRLEYRSFRGAENIDSFASAMLEIERESWKETAGSSLTANPVQERFHTEFLKSAVDTGWLSGHLLLLDGEPVAYVHGLLHNGIFSDLKESYKSRFREMSPGHVLKSFVFESLYAANARIYDFMGLCEEYKMKWTDKTYSRTTYLLYNRTPRAWAAQKVKRLKSFSRSRTGES
ncbi:MAG TPA: GNAT family N-acetyltransferase [Candidatus Acidoferrales bacterium]|nr:GNAT family N-acetyltransferase [Candidatus Acidoferrales bacterium]